MYKKVMALFLVLAFAASVAGCGITDEQSRKDSDSAYSTKSTTGESGGKYIPGIIENGIYKSQWLDLTFTLAGGMEFSDSEVALQTYQRQMQEHPDDYVIDDLCVYQINSNTTPVQVRVRKLTDPNATVEQCAEFEKQVALDAYKVAENGFGIVTYTKWYEPTTVQFSGHEYLLQYWVSQGSDASGDSLNRCHDNWDLFRIHDGHVVQIRFSIKNWYADHSSKWTITDLVKRFGENNADPADFQNHHQWLTRVGWIDAVFGTNLGSSMENGDTYHAQWLHSSGGTYTLAITIDDRDQISMTITDDSGNVVDSGRAEYNFPNGDGWFDANWASGRSGTYEYRYDPLNITLTQTSQQGFAGTDQKPGDVLVLVKQ